MKLKFNKMLGFCKSRKQITVAMYGDHKYLSNGDMMMCIDEAAPDWYSADILTSLQIDEDKKDSFKLTDICGVTNAYPPILVENLTEVSRLIFSVKAGGAVLAPFALPTGDIFFINEDMLDVFINAGVKRWYYGKWLNMPALYIAIDTLVIGAILPITVNLDTMKNFAREFSSGVTKSAEIGFLDAGGQISLEV